MTRRSEEHIEYILGSIREVWLKTPEQRLGQLLLNAITTTDDPLLFYIPDIKLVEAARHFARECEPAVGHDRECPAAIVVRAAVGLRPDELAFGIQADRVAAGDSGGRYP